MANAWVSLWNVGGIVSINFLASVLRVQTSRGDLEMQRVMAAHVVVDEGDGMKSSGVTRRWEVGWSRIWVTALCIQVQDSMRYSKNLVGCGIAIC